MVSLYERQALAFDRLRSRALQERAWLDRFLAHVPPGGTVLDLGCGSGEPLIDHGRSITGIDSSPSMIGLCQARFPDAEWLVADMRRPGLDRRFAGILAWDSFFHLGMEDQREMLEVFAELAQPGGALMFTSGSAEGEAIGTFCGEPLHHASLSPPEYRQILAAQGFIVRAHVAEDPNCGDHTIWLATRDGDPAGRASG